MTARDWLAGLARRGIATRVVNGRIRHFPSSAYKQLTDDEVLFLRHNREAIKLELLDPAGPSVQTSADPAGEALVPTSAPAPAPLRCPHCARLKSECDALRADDLDVWLVICGRNPEAQQVKDERRTAEMMSQLGKPLPAWYRR